MAEIYFLRSLNVKNTIPTLVVKIQNKTSNAYECDS